jgi:hypothetical protein
VPEDDVADVEEPTTSPDPDGDGEGAGDEPDADQDTGTQTVPCQGRTLGFVDDEVADLADNEEWLRQARYADEFAETWACWEAVGGWHGWTDQPPPD